MAELRLAGESTRCLPLSLDRMHVAETVFHRGCGKQELKQKVEARGHGGKAGGSSGA